MKKLTTIAVFAGLLIIPNLQGAEQPADKPWNISATVRGFYDDNYLTRYSKSMGKRDSYGFEVSPEAKVAIRQEMTTLEASYRYGMRYYEDRSENTADHSHEFNVALGHTFSDRCKLSFEDSFVVAQEPQVMEPLGGVTVPLRTEGNNMRNRAAADLSYKVTDIIAIEPGYSFTFYDYEQKGTDSRSALLDRYEHLAYLNFRWINMLENTDGLIGYQFGAIDHNSKDLVTLPGGIWLVSPDLRDNYSHYAYVGAEHRFTDLIRARVLVGAEYTKYRKAGNILRPILGDVDTDDVNPFVDASFIYGGQYGEFQLGVRHARSQTDLVVFDAEATSVYGMFKKDIIGGLKGSIMGSHQFSAFKDPTGALNNQNEGFTMLGANLTYEFNKFVAAEVGYN
ncbi:MAG: hypothetical protein N2487_01405, partial [Verrucomicrobiae bacterium]|nr:hypothetical protein [Verrucomicrobiae bacterium]